MKINSKPASISLPLLTLVFLLALWETLTRWLKVPDYILPPPSAIYHAFRIMGGQWWENYQITLWEAASGLVIGSLFGFLIGTALAKSTVFNRMALPFLIASNAIPVIAIAPIIIIWFGNSLLAKIVVAAFISFFPLALNTYKGLKQYRSFYLELFQVYGASKTDFLLRFQIGNAIPYIWTGLKLNATLSVIGAIVGEFVSADRGLGFAILQASYNFDAAKLWANIFLTCSIGIIFYTILYLTENFILNKFKID
jgi:NitT/TauT family transport system permease protein